MTTSDQKRMVLPSIALAGGAIISAHTMIILAWVLEAGFHLVMPEKVEGAFGALLTLVIGYFMPGGRHGETQ